MRIRQGYIKSGAHHIQLQQWGQPGWIPGWEAWAERPPLRWDIQLTIPIRAIFIGEITEFEIKHLSPYMQFEETCISMFSCFYIFKVPWLCVSVSPLGLHWGGEEEVAPEQEGMWSKICSSCIQNRNATSDLEARQYIFKNPGSQGYLQESHKQHFLACLCTWKPRWSVMPEK